VRLCDLMRIFNIGLYERTYRSRPREELLHVTWRINPDCYKVSNRTRRSCSSCIVGCGNWYDERAPAVQRLTEIWTHLVCTWTSTCAVQHPITLQPLHPLNAVFMYIHTSCSSCMNSCIWASAGPVIVDDNGIYIAIYVRAPVWFVGAVTMPQGSTILEQLYIWGHGPQGECHELSLHRDVWMLSFSNVCSA